MNSKDFQVFLNNESDDDILEAQYVIVSNRIRRLGTAHDNVIQANVLFPDPEVAVLVADDDEKYAFREKYFEQLDKNKTLIALLIESVILSEFNIIFICTKKEEKLGNYLDVLAQYIYNEFDFPVYNYMDVAKGRIDIIDYDTAKVYAKCKEISSLAKKKEVITKLTNDRKLSSKNKKVLKKILKEHDLYTKGMSTKEMRDTFEAFFGDIW